MSREDLQGTTSRRVLIQGMTNTDQVGFWQAPPRAQAAQRQEAEVLPDAGDGADAGGDDGGEERNEMGLTAAEQAEFEAMRTGGEAPAAGDEDPAAGEGDDNDEGDAGDDDTTVQDPPEQQAQQRQPGEKPPAQAEQQKNPKTVNYSKYQRELKRANEQRAVIEQQLQKERDDRIKLNTRLEMINEALQQQAAPAAQQQQPEVPQNPFEEEDIDPNEDFAQAIAQINRRQRFQLESQQEVRQTIDESREDTAIKETFTRDFAAYAAKEPTLPAAYQHLKDARLTQICLGEFGKDPNDPNEVFTPQEVQRMVQMFNNEEKWLVGKAIKEKRSPAAAIMAMAKTFGFSPAAWTAQQDAARNGQQQDQQRQPPAGQQRKPAAQVPATQQRQPPAQQQEPNAMELLEQLRVNQENGRSLSDGGGAPPMSGLTAEMILRLGDAEFAELLDGMPEHQLNTIMGRMPT
jgi:hypothetical protein